MATSPYLGVYATSYPAYDGGTAPSQPAAPTNLRATATTSSTISLAWEAAAGTYTLQRAPVTSGTVGAFATLNPGPGTTNAYQDGGLTYVTEYAYRVLVTVNGVASAYSAVLRVTTAGGAQTTTYALQNGQFWNNGQSLSRGGYTVRSPYSYVRFALPAGVSDFEVQVTTNLPTASKYDSLRSVGVRVGGVYAQSIATANGTDWYTVTVAAGSSVDLLNGFLEKVPGQDFVGVFVNAVRLAGTPTFQLPVPPASRIIGYGDSIMSGAFATAPGQNTALQLVRAELLNQGYDVTQESYSARSLADDYAETSDRSGFIAKLGSMRDGTQGNLLLVEVGTNDDDTGVFKQRAGALVDAYHAAYPADRILYQLPTLRTDGYGDIAAKQQAVREIADIRSWVQVVDTGVVQADLFTDNLHLSTAGHRKVADAYKDAILNPPAVVVPTSNIISARQSYQAGQLTPAADWYADQVSGYVSSNGYYSSNPNARHNWQMTNAIGFDYNSITVPNGSSVAFYYRATGSGATYQLLGTGTQISNPQGTATIFSTRALPKGNYDVYMNWNGAGTFGGLLADQIVIYSVGNSTPAPSATQVFTYDSAGVTLGGGMAAEDPAYWGSYIAGKGAVAFDKPAAYWEVAVPDGASSFIYENFLSAQYGVAVRALVNGSLVGSGSTVGGSTNIFGAVALPAGTGRVLRYEGVNVGVNKALQFDKLTFTF